MLLVGDDDNDRQGILLGARNGSAPLMPRILAEIGVVTPAFPRAMLWMRNLHGDS
jgi:hypothetical protein